jgi:hypothetical protein
MKETASFFYFLLIAPVENCPRNEMITETAKENFGFSYS